MEHGHLSSTGRCYDIGTTVCAALRAFEATGNPYAGPSDPDRAGNGSLMRLAPVPLFYLAEPAEAIERAGESSRTTHSARTAINACRYFAGLIVGALLGRRKEELLGELFSPVPGYWQTQPLTPEIDASARGSFKRRRPPEIRGSGYVVHSLEAALWAFHQSDSFEAGCLLAANLGEDADTTAAVYGQLAGAFYGEAGIPERWRSRLAHRALIKAYADRLHARATARGGASTGPGEGER